MITFEELLSIPNGVIYVMYFQGKLSQDEMILVESLLALSED